MKHFRLRQAHPFVLTTALLAVCLFMGNKIYLQVEATTSAQYQQQMNQTQTRIDQTQSELDKIYANISAYESQAEILEEQLEDVNAEIVNTLTEIDLKEDEIEATTAALEDKQREIDEKQDAIDAAQKEYEEAVARVEKQHDDMVLRARAMYEQNPGDILSLIMQGHGLSDILNRLDYVEAIYEYDNRKLGEYNDAKDAVYEFGLRLAAEKVELEGEKTALEGEKTVLESQKAELEESKAQLASLQSKLKAQSKDYEALIKKANQAAAVASAQLKQEKAQLAALAVARDNAAKAEAGGGNGGTQTTPKASASGNYTSDYNSVIDGAGGSDLGKTIAKYACQYIGNPYVSGGTSLTNGADCSGFTYRVYADFGYSIPRTSYSQRSAGTGVDYANAQPGDLICYDGHVAMYIGGGLIVHASTARTGIKIGTATYRSILSVRRIVN